MRRSRPPRGLRRGLYQVADTAAPALLVELYYWSREPQFVSIIRQFNLLPDEARDTLMAFFALAKDSEHSVTITISRDGVLTLSSPQVSEYVRKLPPLASGQLWPPSVH